MSDLLFVSFDKDERRNETGICSGRKNKDGSYSILKMELDKKADYLYALLTNQEEEAIPISVIEDIKAEIKELIDWHDCPMELDNGNDAWYCEACNMAISIIDKHIKEFTE